MAISPRVSFAHRHNPDGSFDSICSGCFATLATTAEESNLREAEESHDCPGFSLNRLFHSPDGKANLAEM